MSINNLAIPYGDFVYKETIVADEFDSNNEAIQTKINEIVGFINSTGLDGTGRNISNEDINNVDGTGFYTGVGFVNRPSTVADYSACTLINIKQATGLQSQLLTDLVQDVSYTRVRSGVSWGEWNRLVKKKELGLCNKSDTFSVPAGGTVDYTIAYPAGQFSSAPVLRYSLSASDINPLYTLAHGIIENFTTGAKIRFINKGSNVAYVIVNWDAKPII